jgi:hypothetical protein
MTAPRTRDRRPPSPQAAPRFAVTDGRETVGHVVEIAGGYEARTAAGELVGTYATPLDAARALPLPVVS